LPGCGSRVAFVLVLVSMLSRQVAMCGGGVPLCKASLLPRRIPRRDAQFCGVLLDAALSLVEFGLSVVRQLLAFVGDGAPAVGRRVAFRGDLIAPVGHEITLVGGPHPLGLILVAAHFGP